MASWIFWLKFYGFATRRAPDVDPWFWGSGKLVDGWLAFAALVVVLGIVMAVARRRHASSAAGVLDGTHNAVSVQAASTRTESHDERQPRDGACRRKPDRE